MSIDPSTFIPAGTDGVWTAADLRAEGWSYDAIIAAAQEGMLERFLHGVYLDPDQRTDRTSLIASLRYTDQRRPPGHVPSVVTGLAALITYGVVGADLPQVPLLAVDERSRLRPGNGRFDIVRHTVRPDEAARRAHVRLAPIERAFADAARLASMTDAQIREAADRIRNEGLSTMPLLVSGWRRSGAGVHHRLEEMLEGGTFEQESDGERDAFRLLFRAHPPEPDCQVVVHSAFRADFVFISAGLIIEYHGRESHRDRVERDATRTLALELAGWRVIVVTASALREAARLAAHIHCIRQDREQRITAGTLPRPALPTQPERISPLRTVHPSS